ncbi:MAG TPA: hypothetical protein VGD69_11260 [Herpetosiphonaceae bacterium]
MIRIITENSSTCKSGPLRAFSNAIAANDPKRIAAYQTILWQFVAWLATMPGGEPFGMDLVTIGAILLWL